MNETLLAELNKKLKTAITLDTLKEVFAFLRAIRDTGKVNMLATAPYLEKEFGFNRWDAKNILHFWAKNFKPEM